MVNIPQGAVLTFAATADDDDHSIRAEVTGKKIRMMTPPPPENEAGAWNVGDELSLSGAAAKVLRSRPGGYRGGIRGPTHWYYENESLLSRRLRMETEDGDDD